MRRNRRALRRCIRSATSSGRCAWMSWWPVNQHARAFGIAASASSICVALSVGVVSVARRGPAREGLGPRGSRRAVRGDGPRGRGALRYAGRTSARARSCRPDGPRNWPAPRGYPFRASPRARSGRRPRPRSAGGRRAAAARGPRGMIPSRERRGWARASRHRRRRCRGWIAGGRRRARLRRCRPRTVPRRSVGRARGDRSGPRDPSRPLGCRRARPASRNGRGRAGRRSRRACPSRDQVCCDAVPHAGVRGEAVDQDEGWTRVGAGFRVPAVDGELDAFGHRDPFGSHPSMVPVTAGR